MIYKINTRFFEKNIANVIIFVILSVSSQLCYNTFFCNFLSLLEKNLVLSTSTYSLLVETPHRKAFVRPLQHRKHASQFSLAASGSYKTRSLNFEVSFFFLGNLLARRLWSKKTRNDCENWEKSTRPVSALRAQPPRDFLWFL